MEVKQSYAGRAGFPAVSQMWSSLSLASLQLQPTHPRLARARACPFPPTGIFVGAAAAAVRAPLSLSLARVRSFFRASEARRIITVTSRGHFRQRGRGKKEEKEKKEGNATDADAATPPKTTTTPPLLSGNFSSFPAFSEAPSRSPSLSLSLSLFPPPPPPPPAFRWLVPWLSTPVVATE